MKDQIEEELGLQLEWNELVGKWASRLKYAREADVKNKDNWEEYVKWCSDKVVLFHSVFSKYIKKIN